MGQGARGGGTPAARDYAARWLAIAVLAAVVAIGLAAYGVGFDVRSAWGVTRGIALLAAMLPLYWLLARRLPLARRAVAVSTDLLGSLLQLVVLIEVLVPLSYLAARCGAGVPYDDATLARADAALGFDWATAAHWFAAQPRLGPVATRAYDTLAGQAMALLVLGSVLRRGRFNGEFIWVTIVAGLLTALVSAAVPAFGKVGQLGPHYGLVLDMIRSGRWTRFSYSDADGIVSFPSFHTTMALVFPYIAARTSPWLLVVFVPLNALLLLAVFPVGGHYLVDAVAGAAVAVAAIVAVRSAGSAAPVLAAAPA